jgi:hypothetical protein
MASSTYISMAGFWNIMFAVIFILVLSKIRNMFKKKRDFRTITSKKAFTTKNPEGKKEETYEVLLEMYQPYDIKEDIHGFSKFFKKIKLWFQERFKYADMMGINMELNSGKFIEFLIPIDNVGFNFAGGRYLVDTELKYDKANSKFFWLDYHEGYCLPVSRHINIKAIREGFSLKNVQTAHIQYATNPQVLEAFEKSDIAQKILRNNENGNIIIYVLIIIVIFGILYLAWRQKKIEDMITTLASTIQSS